MAKVLDPELRVLNEYPGHHHYWETYTKDVKLHCVNCGSKGIWVASDGDYYAGPDHVCTECGHKFSMPCGPGEMREANEKGILEQLRTGAIKEPTTKKGG